MRYRLARSKQRRRTIQRRRPPQTETVAPLEARPATHELQTLPSGPLRQAALLQMSRTYGNRYVQRMVATLQRAPLNSPTLEKIRKELNSLINVNEGQVLDWVDTLSAPEKQEIAESRYFDYKGKMAGAFNLKEMLRAVKALSMSLAQSLAWLNASVTFTRSIGYNDLRPIVLGASDKSGVHDDQWRDFFIKVCTNADIIQAVRDLKLPLHRQLEWIMEEVTSAQMSLKYQDIKPLITESSATDQAIFLQGRWRTWLMKVCDNDTILEALKDLKLPIKDRVRLVLEEGNAGTLLGGGIDPAKLAEAMLNEFQGDARDVIELVGLNNWKPEDAARIREIMSKHASSRPTTAYKDTFGETAKQHATAAQAVIDQFTSTSTHTSRQTGETYETKHLDYTALAKHLATLMASDPSLVRQVMETIADGIQDNVACIALEQIPDNNELKKVAESEAGRDLLLKMTHKMYKGDMSDDERKQMQRAMRAVSAADTQKRETSAKTPDQAAAEVEVLTFLYGGRGLDSVGKAVGNFRGHTAIVIGGLVYSFELGWRCGLTKDEYVHEKSAIDFVGHVLKVSAEDAKKLQENLNAACGTGHYGVTGNICTGKASVALEQALGSKLYMQVQNPGLFAQYLEAAGVVSERRFYPAKAKAGDKH